MSYLAKQGYSEDSLKREFERVANLCESKEDYSNLLRAYEDIAKIQGFFKENKAIQAVAVFGNLEQDIKRIEEIKKS